VGRYTTPIHLLGATQHLDEDGLFLGLKRGKDPLLLLELLPDLTIIPE
jgi:hypothetical protein